MSQTLLRIAKLLPMLGTTSDNERLVTLAMIEKTLRADGLSFTDAGQELANFVKTIMAEPEPEPIPAPRAEPKPAPNSWGSPQPNVRPQWTSASAPPPRQSQSRPQPQPRPQPPPPPQPPKPPRTWTESIEASIRGMAPDAARLLRIDLYEKRLNRYLNLSATASRPLIRNKNERQFLEDMYFRISSSTDPDTLTAAQKNWLSDILNRAPINF